MKEQKVLRNNEGSRSRFYPLDSLQSHRRSIYIITTKEMPRICDCGDTPKGFSNKISIWIQCDCSRCTPQFFGPEKEKRALVSWENRQGPSFVIHEYHSARIT